MDRIAAHLKAIEKRLDDLSQKELEELSLDFGKVHGGLIRRISRLKAKNSNVIAVNFRKEKASKKKSQINSKKTRKPT